MTSLVNSLLIAMNENERLRKALEQCAAKFATPPGSVDQCQAAISNEFQRRMDIAGEALRSPQETIDD